MTPKIAMLVASHDTQAALRSWALREGFDLTRTYGGREIPDSQFTFHVTLLATANPISAPETQHQIAPIEIEPAGFQTLGPKETPVLVVHAGAALLQARQFFVTVYGAEPTFEDFKPHISLSYAWDGEPALEDLDLPDFPLVFDQLVVNEFKPEQKALILSRSRRPPGAHMVYR